MHLSESASLAPVDTNCERLPCSVMAQVGWEETTEAAMTQLLKSSLARHQKDATAAVPPLTPAADTARLQKHVSLVLERLSKGMKLISS